jgi:hypothetical protein
MVCQVCVVVYSTIVHGSCQQLYAITTILYCSLKNLCVGFVAVFVICAGLKREVRAHMCAASMKVKFEVHCIACATVQTPCDKPNSHRHAQTRSMLDATLLS